MIPRGEFYMIMCVIGAVVTGAAVLIAEDGVAGVAIGVIAFLLYGAFAEAVRG